MTDTGLHNSIVEYGMATAGNHKELLVYVQQAICEGFQPFGNVFTTNQYEQNFIHQPMVRYELKKKNSLK
jgi:hypothetical protein